MKNALHDVLRKYDIARNEYQPFHVICREIKDVTLGEKSIEVDAEIMALTFGENEDGETGPWGTFFKPNMRYRGPEGVFENPNYENITEEIIDYWKKRAENTENLYLKIRYLGLVFEFNSKVTDRPFDSSLTIPYIEAIILLCEENNNIEPRDLKRLILRAFQIVVKLKNIELEKRTIKAVIALEDKISKDLELTTWGFCFENLVLKNCKKLTKEQINKLVLDIKNRITRLGELKEPYLIEQAVEVLTQYYRSKRDQLEVEKIVKTAASVMKSKALKSNPVIALDIYQNLHSLYKKNNMHEAVKEAEKLISDIGPKVVNMMIPIKVSTSIDTRTIDDYIDGLIDVGFEKAICRVLNEFIPDISKIREQIDHTSSIDPIFSLCTNKRIFAPSTGQLITTIKPSDQDENLSFNYVQNLEVENLFMILTFEKLFDKYNIRSSTLVDYIYQSQVFKENARLIIEKGVEAYFDDNHIVAMHLIIPQLEAGFRNIIKIQESSVTKANNIGGMNFILFAEILKNDLLKNYFDADMIFYFKAILNDQKGLNLRNDVCHGLLNSTEFTESKSARIIHILLILAQVRFK